MIQEIAESIQRAATLEKKLFLTAEHFQIGDDQIQIQMGEASIILYKNGSLKFVLYSKEDRRRYEITGDDLIKLVKASN
jgi:hypothetical protein